MSSKIAVIIPARYESSRLPGKPLVSLVGVPMVVRTYRQVIKACDPAMVYVATESDLIREVCEAEGIQVLMTSKDCLTGTDRVAECAALLDADLFINVQGDEPLFDPADIEVLLEAAKQYPGEVLNGYCAIHDEAHFRSKTTPKAVFRQDGRLLYMSRGAIPTTKTHSFVSSWRQVCTYAFPRAALQAFSAQASKTPLEQMEDIEILRFLELGWEVRMIPMSENSMPVDTPEDIALVEAAIRQLESTKA
ncbi:3-deoxy-manno-octulosonate cytidylyltransferase [Pseudomethylobacillus aquaticus]|uniref:3-deoxy-manno-octulosonate cytidylyltransferase n=1 Tax=Pseudomethylobacillus aquaticus TaxID=2676064 RepID=A0A3N0V2Z2_9PROT|nr:3-deoxy-manno-octulosonate cytidylyltransferase [Pseudomethylobacillus aquaticus]ROH87075.1 3-deoxy-manno-octulosonate cytidylyltransferase [Pseudomethylobacillus aquaticus]